MLEYLSTPGQDIRYKYQISTCWLGEKLTTAKYRLKHVSPSWRVEI